MYRWPSSLPEGFAIQPVQSSSNSTSFSVAVAGTNTGQFGFAIVGGPDSQAARPPVSRNRSEVMIRGHSGAAFTTGAGYSIYWQENGHAYAIIGGLGLDAALAIAHDLETLELDQWRTQRDATSPQ